MSLQLCRPGPISDSWRSLFIDRFLPRQFLMHYTYEFLYRIKCSLYSMRIRAQSGLPLRAHSVAEELLVTFCEQEASADRAQRKIL